MGFNVIEAAALGTPSIAYNVPGLCDSIKNNITGVLVNSDSPKDLAQKILMILKDNRLRQQLSINALKYSFNFSWEQTTKELMNIFLKNL